MATISDSDRFAVILFCFAGVMALVLYLVEKTPLSISMALAIMFVLLVYPILHYCHKTPTRVLVLIFVALATVALGYATWPKKENPNIGAALVIDDSSGDYMKYHIQINNALNSPAVGNIRHAIQTSDM